MNNTTTTARRSFEILNMTRGDFSFEVHKAGCRDIKRELSWKGDAQDAWPGDADSAADLVAAEVDIFQHQDQGYTADDFRIMPCCKHAPTVEAEAPAEVVEAEVIEVEVAEVADKAEAAAAEIARRQHNRKVKKTGEGTRIEAATDWAFNASIADLRAIIAS